MLACRIICAVAVLAVAASHAEAQSGHYPGPRTRYEWNPSPYTGSFNNGGYRGGGGWSSGYHPGGYGYGYGFGYGYPAYPVITPPIFVPFGATYYGTYGDGWYGPQWPPSYTNYGYSPVNPFVVPGGAMNGRWPNDVPDPLREPPQARRRDRLKQEDRLPIAKPSTPEEQQRSLKHQATGDQQFQAGRFLRAAESYRKAIAAAEDLPDNYFRLAITLTELRRYDDAVDQLKYGLLLDPSWPTRGGTLASYYGDEVNFGKASMVHRVGDWVRGDVRNPDRIFLLAVLLYFDGDRENARTLFESAIRVAGEEPYLTAFLKDDDQIQDQQVQPANDAVPAPPAAGVRQRQAPQPKPPAPPTGPDEPREQPVPQRLVPPVTDPITEPETFPSLKTPDLPRSSTPPDDVSSLPAAGLSGPNLTGP